jgi:hypothetical protein
MEPILVPGTPKEAFNKHRRISDLVKKQVEHFQHIEERLPADVRASLPQLPQLDNVTENEAARYISAITSYLLSRPKPKQAAKKIVAIKPPAAARPAQPLALAAAAAPTGKKASTGKAAPTGKKSAAKKKSAPKKETSAPKKSLSTTTSSRTKAKKSSSKRKK